MILCSLFVVVAADSVLTEIQVGRVGVSILQESLGNGVLSCRSCKAMTVQSTSLVGFKGRQAVETTVSMNIDKWFVLILAAGGKEIRRRQEQIKAAEL